jgi:hypothetical protein
MLSEIKLDYHEWVWREYDLAADVWFSFLVDLTSRVLALGDYIGDPAETTTAEWLTCRVIIARYAGAVAAMRAGFDPRACPRCGGDHLDFALDDEPGLACENT